MTAPLIRVEGVSVVRDGAEILHDVSIVIEQGEHIAILGPNGCGKSTLIKILTREIYPYAGLGRVEICGLNRWQISQLRTMLGVVSEEPREPLLGEPTGLEYAVSGLIGTYGILVQHHVTPEMMEQGRGALVLCEAERLADRTVNTMSTGERRRVAIARAVVSGPRALVLDEPTNGLDLKAAFEFHDLVRRLIDAGITVILVTHHLEELTPEITRVITMKNGRITADGSRADVLTVDHLAGLFDVSSVALRERIRGQLRGHHSWAANDGE